jgi:hypothetical protein
MKCGTAKVSAALRRAFSEQKTREQNRKQQLTASVAVKDLAVRLIVEELAHGAVVARHLRGTLDALVRNCTNLRDCRECVRCMQNKSRRPRKKEQANWYQAEVGASLTWLRRGLLVLGEAVHAATTRDQWAIEADSSKQRWSMRAHHMISQIAWRLISCLASASLWQKLERASMQTVSETNIWCENTPARVEVLAAGTALQTCAFVVLAAHDLLALILHSSQLLVAQEHNFTTSEWIWGGWQ